MAQAPAGWYPDPSGAPGQRYFDGTTWTQWTYAADQGSTPQVRSDQQRGIDALRRAKAGDVAGAISDLKNLLADQIRILGPDHPDVLATRGKLAECLEAKGDKDDAIIEYRYLLAGQVRTLGPDHRETLDTRTTLARLRQFNRSAIKDHESLLADLIRILGRDHPDTLPTRKDLAEHRYYAGDKVGAVHAYEELLAEQIRIRGRDHPDTLATRGELANHRRIAGDSAGAVREHEELLAEQIRILGPDHSATLRTRENLANNRRTAGDTAGAIRDYEALLADRLRLGVMTIKSTSPGDRYVVCVDPFEARAYQWVETPELFDTATGRALLAFADRYWHLDSAKWQSESVVVMDLRHFPYGNGCTVVIDCQRLTASVNGAKPGPLGQLGDVLERPDRAHGRAQAAAERSSSQPAPMAKAAKPIVGLGLAAGVKRPGAKKAAPAVPPAEAAPPPAAPEPT
jgi:tetratricopeptide (TPR) repeat protein